MMENTSICKRYETGNSKQLEAKHCLNFSFNNFKLSTPGITILQKESHFEIDS